MPLASFAQAKLAVGIFCLGTLASFDGGMIILIQSNNMRKILGELLIQYNWQKYHKSIYFHLHPPLHVFSTTYTGRLSIIMSDLIVFQKQLQIC